jgi:hypothetical protein
MIAHTQQDANSQDWDYEDSCDEEHEDDDCNYKLKNDDKGDHEE